MNKPPRIAASHRLDLTHRPRRNRKAEWTRRLVAEHVLTTGDLIWPLFLIDGEKRRVPVAAMPGVDRLTVEEAVREAERRLSSTSRRSRSSPPLSVALKDAEGSEAFNEGKPCLPRLPCDQARIPGACLVTDVALDPYTATATMGSCARALRAGLRS